MNGRNMLKSSGCIVLRCHSTSDIQILYSLLLYLGDYRMSERVLFNGSCGPKEVR